MIQFWIELFNWIKLNKGFKNTIMKIKYNESSIIFDWGTGVEIKIPVPA